MSKPSLNGVDLKLDRAHKQLTALASEVRPFEAASNNSPIVGEFDSEAREYVFRLEADPPPPHWGVYVSEIAHHLRSCLDNLLWQVIEKRGGKPSRETQFPILNSAQDLKGSDPRIEGVSTDDRAYIERAQPYHFGPHWGKRHRLALLHHLNNIDKHRFMHAGFIAGGVALPSGVRIPWHADLDDLLTHFPPDAHPPTVFQLQQPFPKPLNADVGDGYTTRFPHDENSTEIMRVSLPNAGPDPKMEVQNRPPFSVSLSDRERPVTIDDLYGIGLRVQGIVDHFREIF